MIRCLAVPRWWRRRTFATPEADRSTPRFLRCRSNDFGPSVGRAIASDRITATSSEVIAFGWCGRRRSRGSSAERPYCSALLIHS